MKKRLFAACITMVLVLSMIGCAFGEALPAGIDWSKHQEFSWWMYSTVNDYYLTYSDNPVVKYLNEKFNVTLNFEQPASGTEADSLSLMFGTGQYTDAIEITRYTGSVSQLYNDGVIIDIAEYLDYMPNLTARMEANETLRKHAYNDNGQILKLPTFAEYPEIVWGSLMYRHDILESVTGGNVKFPSGSETPTTVEDWDYMLPLFKQYFEEADLVEYAPLIIPFNAYFHYGELITGFGSGGADYYVQDGKVSHGLLDSGAYDYVAKLAEWYSKGYIYQDFASRVNDMFFMPNTALTYGGAAGIWYGTNGQLGSAMSNEYFDVDVRAVGSPLNDGVTPEDTLKRNPPAEEASGVGTVVTTKCPDIPKLLSIVDFMYSDEGGMMWQYGLDKEHIPSTDVVYAANGLEDGLYWFEDGQFSYNPLTDKLGGPIRHSDMIGQRIPGYSINRYERANSGELQRTADAIWTQYDAVATKKKLPASLSYTLEDDKFMSEKQVTITDYLTGMLPKFIMGTEPLSDASWKAFIDQLKAYGIDDIIALRQAAYDRYSNR